MIKGFMGKTHALLSIMLLCFCMIIPITFFKETYWLLKDNILLFIVCITAVVGGALLPDLDNCQSSAGSTLGPLGSICTIFMQSVSTIIWNLVRGKGDRPPMTPHRYFWHTCIVSVGFICLLWFGIPNEQITILGSIKQNGIEIFLQEQPTVVFFMFILFMAVLVGSNMIMYRVISFFKLPKLLFYIFPVAVLIYIFTIDYSLLRIVGLCVGSGYLFHVIEDIFADHGVPFIWPIPIRNQLWHKIKFIITCQTGGLINTIIDVIVLIIDLCLIAFIFLGGNL